MKVAREVVVDPILELKVKTVTNNFTIVGVLFLLPGGLIIVITYKQVCGLRLITYQLSCCHHGQIITNPRGFVYK